MTEKKMQLVDWLDDLCVRFIINLPQEELQSVERICFQVEEAQWFYEDFIRPLDPDLPSLNLRNFCLLIFQHCPMLSEFSTQHHTMAFSEFLAYKTRVPVRGAILLNQNMDEVVLVKGWKKGANWSFPRGKINKDEPDLDCAVREVYEETGYDLKAAGLVPKDRQTKYIEMTMREQHMRLYVFRGIPMDTQFEPRTRKEISKIQWYRLSELPTVKNKKQQQEGKGEDLAIHANKFYMVAPFLGSLKKWIAQQRKFDRTRQPSQPAMTADAGLESAVEEPQSVETNGSAPTNDDMARLLHGLRKSSHPMTSDLPEVAGGIIPDTKVESKAPPKSADLLALLRGEGGPKTEQKPQTPSNQIVEQPTMPASPHHHHPSVRIPTLPTPPAFPYPPDQIQQMAPVQTSSSNLGSFVPSVMLDPQPEPQLSHFRPIPTPTQPAQLAPRFTGPKSGNASDRQAPAPYRRTGDPQFAQRLHPSSKHQPPSIPPASKLPPPKMTAQSSALLSLFKSGQPSTSSVPNGVVPGTQMPANIQKEKVSNPANMLVPAQVLPQPKSITVAQRERPQAGHQANLLNLLRAPSTATVPESKTLQPPQGPVELSAVNSPGHTTRASLHPEPPTYKKASVGKVQNGSFTAPKHAQANAAVSATVSGPLNIPQFDIIAKSSRESKKSSPHNDTRPPKRSPVTILARPTNPQGQQSTAASATTSTRQSQPVMHAKPQAPPLIMPSKASTPATPSLKGQEAPPKPFHPQILRRPGNLQDLNEPSPIQPLPSPKHSALPPPRPTNPSDHKKSLLSLFTKSSPGISPSTSTPHPNSALDPASLISPLSDHPTTSQHFRAKGVFAAPPQGAAKVPQSQPQPQQTLEKRVFRAPDRPPPPSTVSKRPIVDSASATTRTTAAKGNLGANGNNLPPMSPSTTTPVQKEFLLEFLAGVARGGR